MPDKQETHSMETAKLLEHSLKKTLMSLTRHLFGNGKRMSGLFKNL